MGELAVSVAHEIKQPIAAAVTNAQVCLQLLERNEPDVAETRDVGYPACHASVCTHGPFRSAFKSTG
jgi:hypothetical protein